MMRQSQQQGQALVEFALAIVLFLVLIMGVVDFGSAIYRFNGVSQAAREIARVTSVHPCAGSPPCTPGGSAETQAVIDRQKAVIPGLSDPTFTCVDATGAPVAPKPCDFSKHSVRVSITALYTPITPLLKLTGTWTMEGSSSAQIQ
jgi:hypothetical protein